VSTREHAAPALAVRAAAHGPSVVLLALCLFVAATNRWLSWEGGVRLLTARDVTSYEAIARAAPGLPGADLPAHHAERFPVHWVVGTLDDVLGAPLHALYRVLMIAAMAGTLALLHAIVARRLPVAAYAVVVGAFVLNPYALRYQLLVPGMLADATFVLGIAVALFGLAGRRAWAVVAGMALAAVARETVLPVVPVVIAWLALAPDWRAEPGRRRALVGGAVVVAVGAIYAVTRAIAAGFSAPSLPGVLDAGAVARGYSLPAPSLSTLDDYTLLDALSAPGTLAEHLARVATPPLAMVALIAAVLVIARRRGVRPPFPFWGCLALSASIIAQPLLVSPDVLFGNETRLTALGLLPLAAAPAFVLERLRPDLETALRPRDVLLIVGVLAVASLHHLYTVVGPTSPSQIAPIQLVAGALAAWLLVRAARLAPRAPAA
jgi:hypothetical protein